MLVGLYGNFWQTELCLSFPEKITFNAVGLRSSTAESIAAHEALLWLMNKGVINRKRRLIEYSKNEEIKLKETHHAPYSICIPPALLDKMQSVLLDIEVSFMLQFSSVCLFSNLITRKNLTFSIFQ